MTTENYRGSISENAKQKEAFLARFFSFTEFTALSKIAWPLILSSLVTMSVSITDVIMIGKLGTLELASAAAASDFYSVFYYLAAGIAAALSPMIAQARGRRQFREIKTILIQGFLCSALIGIPASLAIYNSSVMLDFIGVQSNIVVTSTPYSHMMALTLFPMLALSVMHYFLSAANATRIILYITAASLPVNILGNYLFLYGSWGAPNLGLAGAGLASAITGFLMFSSLLVYSLRHKRLKRYFRFPVFSKKQAAIRLEIFRVGLPIGISHFGEMGVFLFATVTMGIFGAEALAAHTIALRMAGVFYAIPIAYAQAAMVRIGFLYGRGDVFALNKAISTILSFSVFAGIFLLVLLILIKEHLTGLFIGPDQLTVLVSSQASLFLIMLAIMQPSLVIGTIGGGVLRGFKDSKRPMIYSLTCYWGLGFVGALILATYAAMGGLGIWIGLISATVAFAILVVWRIMNSKIRHINLEQHIKVAV